MAGMTKQMIVLFLVLCLIAAETPLCSAADPDCYDSCSTGCVNKDARLSARCDRKCQIRCGPDAEVGWELH